MTTEVLRPRTLDEVRAELRRFRAGERKDLRQSLLAVIDTTLDRECLPPHLVRLVEAIWHEGSGVATAFKHLGASVAWYLDYARQMAIGNDGTAARMRLAWLRELGLSEGPPVDQDPPRDASASETHPA